jgi:hypothetical protein
MAESSLRQIMTAYFDGLEELFGEPFKQMKQHDVTPADMANNLSSDSGVLRAFEAESENFFGSLIEFWERYGSVVDRHVTELKGLKAVYGGDLFPSHHTGNIASSAGLYMDTVVIPDPVLRIADFRSYMEPKNVLRLTAKHALNALTYRELALAEVEPPIVVIVSDPLSSNAPRVKHLESLADQDLLLHMGKVFGRSFTSKSELAEFLHQFSDLHQIAAATKDSRRVLFDLDWPDDVIEQFRRFGRQTSSQFSDLVQTRMAGRTPGEALAHILFGRLMQSNDIVLSSERLGGTPIVDAPTSWQYLLWKYEYDLARAPATNSPHAHHDLLIAKALQSELEDGTLRLLRASPKVLIELRRNGALAELRNVMRNGFEGITLASASDVETVTNAVVANINAAMLEHQARFEKLARSGVKWYGLEVAPMIVSAAISIVGAATGNVGMATAGAVANALGVATLKDAMKSGKQILRDYKYLRRSATGILFRNL